MAPDTSQWSEYEKVVMYRLGELDAKVDSLSTKVESLTIGLTLTKFKVGLAGGGGGALGTALLWAFLAHFFPVVPAKP